MRKRYIGIALPLSLIKRMDEVLKNDRWGYSSRAELAKEGIRKLILYLTK